MSYQVLARKWRPKNFQQLMGQGHVVDVLVNALEQKRLHHAYLFTGTRGVGKTTIARIFAKSLNCEVGITSSPCGTCATCVDIDEGRFIDLLEIDAASKTKVDDTREILDNVQYAPTRGRFKVYLIDEVHMLSRHSFNALLKTLEEPPEHVKFILATTDPQKLPVTVLSRCLQFHLKALSVAQIEAKLTEILMHEQVSHQPGSLTLLAKAARGSMRDSLSLTDQAIAQGQGNIQLANLQQMLGGVDQNWVYKIVICLLKQDSAEMMALSQTIAAYAPSYTRLYAELIQLFHQVALYQIVEQHFDLPAEHIALLKKFSQAMSADDVQLYYQIVLNGRKDLPYAFDEQAAFDMTLLRLLAFKPLAIDHAVEIATNNNSQPIHLDSEPLENTLSAESSEEQATINKTQDELVEEKNLDLVSNKSPQVDEQTQLQDTSLPIDAATREAHSGESQFDEVHHALSSQAEAIEQQAEQMSQSLVNKDAYTQETAANPPIIESQQQGQDVSLEHQNKGHQNKEQTAPRAEENTTETELNSPVSAVLATRNMLRSRKKQLEQNAKKPDDAAMRHHTTSDNTEHNSENNGIAANASDHEEKQRLPEPTISFQEDVIDPAVIKKANQVDKWAHMIDAMALTARIRQLAIHATISEASDDDHLILKLDQATKHLKTEVAEKQLEEYICQFLSRKVKVTIDLVEQTVADPYQIQSHINDKRYDYAKQLLASDNIVIALKEQFQASLAEDTIVAH